MTVTQDADGYYCYRSPSGTWVRSVRPPYAPHWSDDGIGYLISSYLMWGRKIVRALWNEKYFGPVPGWTKDRKVTPMEVK